MTPQENARYTEADVLGRMTTKAIVDKLNETTRLQARVDAFVQALGCQLCPEDALATIDLKNAALEAYEARVEQLEHELRDTEIVSATRRDQWTDAEKRVDALTQERNRLLEIEKLREQEAVRIAEIVRKNEALRQERDMWKRFVEERAPTDIENAQDFRKLLGEAEALRTALREQLDIDQILTEDKSCICGSNDLGTHSALCLRVQRAFTQSAKALEGVSGEQPE